DVTATVIEDVTDRLPVPAARLPGEDALERWVVAECVCVHGVAPTFQSVRCASPQLVQRERARRGDRNTGKQADTKNGRQPTWLGWDRCRLATVGKRSRLTRRRGGTPPPPIRRSPPRSRTG